jgi:hypothetical protein
MLGKYLSFNDVTFPNPIGPSQTSNPVETVVVSEAGTDLVVMSRASKSAWNFSFELSAAKKNELKAISRQAKTKMVYQGVTYFVRVRNFQEKLVEGSEWLKNIDGLFQVSVTVTEY